MTTLYLSGLAFAVIALLIWALRRDATAKGKAEQNSETYAHVLENIKKANDVRDRLKHDADERKRVRERFTER